MNKVLIIFLFSLLIIAPANASGECNSFALQINGASKHLADGKQAKKEDFQSNNPGLGLVCQSNSSDWMVGAYKNSVFRNSVYVANNRYLRFGGSLKNAWHFDLGIAYGLATGYTEQKRIPGPVGGVSLLSFITASIGQAHIGKINIAWLPTIMVAVNLDIRIN